MRFNTSRKTAGYAAVPRRSFGRRTSPVNRLAAIRPPATRKNSGRLLQTAAAMAAIPMLAEIQPIPVLEQFAAHPVRTGPVAPQQQALHLQADRSQQPFQPAAGDRAVPAPRPLPEQFPHRSQQVAPRRFSC